MTHHAPYNTGTPQCLRLTTEDAAALAVLEGRCFDLPWTPEAFAEALSQTSFSAFGLRDPADPAQLLGYIAVYHTTDELEILNIAVRGDCRQRGYGHQLLSAALQEAAEMGILRAVLEVRPSNVPALRLYASFGFSQVGKRRGYYQDNGEDALVFLRES